MFKNKYYALLVGISIVSILMYFILPIGKISNKAVYMQRTNNLQYLYQGVSAYGLDLYEIYKKLDAWQYITVPNRNAVDFSKLSMIQDENEFYKYCQYRIILCEDWWGIIECEYGLKGKYFLMISKEREIFEFHTPFLPEQKRATFIETTVCDDFPGATY